MTVKELRALEDGTVIRAYYKEDGEHDISTGALISYTPPGHVDFVVKKGKSIRFVRKDDKSPYEWTASEILRDFENGVEVLSGNKIS